MLFTTTKHCDTYIRNEIFHFHNFYARKKLFLFYIKSRDKFCKQRVTKVMEKNVFICLCSKIFMYYTLFTQDHFYEYNMIHIFVTYNRIYSLYWSN